MHDQQLAPLCKVGTIGWLFVNIAPCLGPLGVILAGNISSFRAPPLIKRILAGRSPPLSKFRIAVSWAQTNDADVTVLHYSSV